MKKLETMNFHLTLPISYYNKNEIEDSIGDTLDKYLENETPDNLVYLTMNAFTMSFFKRLIPENWTVDPTPNKTKYYYTNIEVIIDSTLEDGDINICQDH